MEWRIRGLQGVEHFELFEILTPQILSPNQLLKSPLVGNTEHASRFPVQVKHQVFSQV